MVKKIILVVIFLFFVSLAPGAQAVLVFRNTLYLGSANSEVRELQRVLATFPDVYPEQLVTGFFGAKTAQAVRRFQKKYNISQTGTVGPKTRAKLNELSAASPSSPVSKIAPITQQTIGSDNVLSRSFGAGKCEGKGPVTLTSAPMRLEDVVYILPMGLMSGSHVTPVDHLYFHTSHKNTGRYDVLAPADGYVVGVEIVGDSGDYRIIIEHTCTFYTIYIHVTELAPKIAAAAGTFSQGSKAIRVPVQAGEVIGTKVPNMEKKTFQVDFSVANADVMLKGFVVPAHYAGEAWKVHTDDMYTYYRDSLRSQMIAKNIRTAEPVGGKIDYDIDGRLVGNWFRQGTNGYSGSNPYKYWEGHLTIAYDYLDPGSIRVSIGDWGGKSLQAGVKGNAPDPKNVSVETGLVKYELVDPYYVKANGTYWDQETLEKDVRLDFLDAFRHGTLLVQLIDERTLKIETFPGTAASDVNGFSVKAILYER